MRKWSQQKGVLPFQYPSLAAKVLLIFVVRGIRDWVSIAMAYIISSSTTLFHQHSIHTAWSLSSRVKAEGIITG